MGDLLFLKQPVSTSILDKFKHSAEQVLYESLWRGLEEQLTFERSSVPRGCHLKHIEKVSFSKGSQRISSNKNT